MHRHNLSQLMYLMSKRYWSFFIEKRHIWALLYLDPVLFRSLPPLLAEGVAPELVARVEVLINRLSADCHTPPETTVTSLLYSPILNIVISSIFTEIIRGIRISC